MPVYEYECTHCGKRFAKRRNLDNDDSDIECPDCGTKRPKRTVSGFLAGTPSEGMCAPRDGG